MKDDDRLMNVEDFCTTILAYYIFITGNKIKPSNLNVFSHPVETGTVRGPIPASALTSAPLLRPTADSSAAPSGNKRGVKTLKVIREELWKPPLGKEQLGSFDSRQGTQSPAVLVDQRWLIVICRVAFEKHGAARIKAC